MFTLFPGHRLQDNPGQQSFKLICSVLFLPKLPWTFPKDSILVSFSLKHLKLATINLIKLQSGSQKYFSIFTIIVSSFSPYAKENDFCCCYFYFLNIFTGLNLLSTWWNSINVLCMFSFQSLHKEVYSTGLIFSAFLSHILQSLLGS